MIFVVLFFVLHSNDAVANKSEDSNANDITRGGYFDLEFSPSVYANMPYGSGHITIWKHMTEELFFIRPLAHLISNSARCGRNLLTERTEMMFDIQMITKDVRVTVASFLSNLTNPISINQIGLIPMEQIRVVLRGTSDLKNLSYVLADQWKTNTNLPSIISFKFSSSTFNECELLKALLINNPESFMMLEIEYLVSAQKAAKRSIEITGQHVKDSNLFSQLENMNVNGDERFLNSNDVNKMSSQTVSEVISRVVTEGGYVNTGDEVQLRDLVKFFLQTTEANSAGFDDNSWDSVFWSEEWLKPNKLTDYLNKEYSKEYMKEYKKQKTKKEKDLNVHAKVEAGFKPVASASVSLKYSTNKKKKEMENKILENYKENNVKVSWTGEKFEVNPMMLSRINTNQFKSSLKIASQSIQVKEFQEVFSVQVRSEKIDMAVYDSIRNFIEDILFQTSKTMLYFDAESRAISSDLKTITHNTKKFLEEYGKQNSKLKHISEAAEKLNNVDLTSTKNEILSRAQGQKSTWPPGRYCLGMAKGKQKIKIGKHGDVAYATDIDKDGCPEGLSRRDTIISTDYEKPTNIYNAQSSRDPTYPFTHFAFINDRQLQPSDEKAHTIQQMFRMCCKTSGP